MELKNFTKLETPVTVSRADIGIIATVNESGEPQTVYEILMAKKDSIIVRVKGAHMASTPKKLDLPITWTPDGHEVNGVKYQFFKKSGVEIGPKSGKVKRVGKKSEGPSKLSICRELFKDNPTADPATMKGLFIEKAGCTKMGANTYYLLIKGGK